MSAALSYGLTWLALLALAALSLGISHLHLAGWAIPVALAIAVTKAALIALVFMRLGASSVALRLIALSAAAMTALLVSLSAADALTRPPGTQRSSQEP